jgi:hypothetical protein
MMKVLFRFLKHADKTKNRIIIPKFIIDTYGREFYLEVLENGTMTLTPLKKGK